MTQINYNALLTDTAIMAAITANHAEHNSAQLNTHLILVAIAIKWKACGDVRPVVVQINALLEDMPKGVRSNAIREWAEMCLLLAVAEEGDNKGKFYAPKGVKADALDMEAIKNKRWFEMKPEAPYKPMNFAADLTKLLKRGGDRLTADKGDEINPELLLAINRAVDAFNVEAAAKASIGRTMPVTAE
ncbi:hypothetical protein SAMN05216227_102030 [Pseudorhodobacter antarcticus]|uniref:Uncharacterized protein n=1 Tax=Pseudorhodobacter antarcticus TaxID=1077947 RepID=A0A1H8IFW5_9RHOB|nr:hypothetical protein [Pseudorhodobacter antarcticus]SEN67424.1 hypothetical protein SAMN05216227_102030 [Pseudorhodobacter antarcticus]